MLLLDRQSGATAQTREEAKRTGVATNGIQLRLRTDGRLLELLPGRTTIGSSPRCNIRIERPGVQPLHCLIVEGPEGLRIRSWAANATLNSVPFEESALGVGDWLSLGTVEIDVIDPAAATTQPLVLEAPATESNDTELTRAVRDQSRIRSRRLLDTLRHERTTQQELCQQFAKLQESHLDAIAEQNEISNKLENCLAELAAARRQLTESETVGAARQDLASQNEQLGFEIGELSTQLNDSTHAHSEMAKEQKRLENELAGLGEQHRQLIGVHTHLQAELGLVSDEKTKADDQSRHLEIEFDRLAEEKNIINEERRQVNEANIRLQSEVVRLRNQQAAADEQNGQLAREKSRLQNEVDHLSNQKAELEAEREGLRRQNEQLLSESRKIATEQSTLAEERAALCQEWSELRNENDVLRVRVAQLDENNSASEVEKLTLIDQHKVMQLEAKQLQGRLAELSEQNAMLAAANARLAEEQAQSVADKTQVAELERELCAAVANRETTSGELYRALLQLAELQESGDHNEAIVGAYESLKNEHDQLHEEANQLREHINRLNQERSTIENAWQALSAKVAALDESQQGLRNENAMLAVRLDEARQQLETPHQADATLASVVAELERERAAKLQAESEVAAVIAECERRLGEQERRFVEQSNQLNDLLRQHAEQSREFTESINMLERQLAEASEMRDSLARTCEDVQLQLASAESNRSEQARRIHDLESQLAAAELAASRSALEWKKAASDSGNSEAEGEPRTAVEHRDGFGRSGAPDELPSAHELNASTELDAYLRERLDDSATSEAMPGRTQSATELLRSAGVEILSSDSVAESTFQPAMNAVAFSSEEEELRPLGQKSLSQMPDESGTSAKREPASFIDRYSHLFAEDDAASDEKLERSKAQSRPIATDIGRPEQASLASKIEEEDSIEQYMAKLLQRVRGDAPSSQALTTQPSSGTTPIIAANNQDRSTEDSAPPALALSTAAADVEVFATRETQPTDSEIMPVKRKVSSPAPKTDLGALRALANESARRAIGRHELGKLRRNAVTKVIVATLAGVTSLWLMLDSPDWRSVQFVTGCLSLLVAAYWAGETYRTLVESLRAAGYDGPVAGLVEPEAYQAPGLPIDVE
jgi:hypothetical protein